MQAYSYTCAGQRGDWLLSDCMRMCRTMQRWCLAGTSTAAPKTLRWRCCASCCQSCWTHGPRCTQMTLATPPTLRIKGKVASSPFLFVVKQHKHTRCMYGCATACLRGGRADVIGHQHSHPGDMQKHGTCAEACKRSCARILSCKADWSAFRLGQIVHEFSNPRVNVVQILLPWRIHQSVSITSSELPGPLRLSWSCAIL